MSDHTRVIVDAVDNASADLQKIGQNAKRMGGEIEAAGKQAERGFRGVKFSAMEVGGAIGSAVGLVAKFGQASRDQVREVDALSKGYGAATDDIIAFTEAIQDSTNFTNDAAREAAILAGTLTREYGLTADQAQELVSRSADLAQIFGTDLAGATNRLASATRGEAEAAESLGIAMADSVLQARAAAQGMTGWNTTMTEAEKAQVRFQELMRQTAYATGAATEASQGAAGAGADVIAWLDDAAESAGSALGPIGEFAGQFGEIALLAPIAGAGIGKMVASANAARIAGGALNLALGPVGLIAAVVGVGAAFYEMNRRAEESKLSLGEVEASTGDLIATLNRLRDEGADTEVLVGVRQGVEFMQDLGRASNEAEGRIEEVNIVLFQQQRILEDLILSQATQGGSLDETLVARIEAQKQLVAELENTQAALEGAIVDAGQYDAAMTATQHILTLSAQVNYPDLVAEVTRLQVAQANGEISADDYAAAIIQLDKDAGSFGLTLDSLAPKIALVTDRLGAGNAAAGDLAVGLGVVTEEVVALDFAVGNATGGAASLGGEIDSLGESIDDGTTATERALVPFARLLSGLDGLGAVVEDNAAALAHEAEVLADVAAGQAALNQEMAAGVATREQGIAGQRAANAERQAAIEATIAERAANDAARESAASSALAEAAALNTSRDATVAQGEALMGNVASYEAAIAGMDAMTYSSHLANDGLLSLTDQSLILTAVQGELAGQAQDLSGEIGVWNSAVSDMEAAYEALNDQQARGQELSQEELEFLDLYDARLNGAAVSVEDLKIQRGLLAAQQLDNLEAQEDLTETMGESNETMVDLVDVLGDFVDAWREVNGLPPLDNLAPPDGLAASWDDVTDSFDAAMAALAKGELPGKTGLSGTHGYEVVQNPDGTFTSRPGGGYGEGAGGQGGTAAPANQAPPSQGLLSPQIAVTPVVVPIIIDALSLEQGVQNIAVFLEETIGEPVTMIILGNGEGAIAVIEDLDSNVRAIVTEDHVVFIEGNADGALSDAEAVTLAMDAIDGDSSTVYVYADTDPAENAIAGVTGFQGNAYVNVYANRIGFSDLDRRLGGVVPDEPYAARNGRVVTVGEAGAENVFLPTGSYVQNAPATRAHNQGQGGGRGITIQNLVIRADSGTNGRRVARDFVAEMTAMGR